MASHRTATGMGREIPKLSGRVFGFIKSCRDRGHLIGGLSLAKGENSACVIGT